MKKLMFLTVLVSLLFAGDHVLAGDTGTYRILSYRVALTPRSDGSVAIDYYQRWLVTGGHIPWITVGTPNSDFTVTGSGGAAVDAAPASGGGWSGVRLALDADYQEGQTFEASFSIVQRGLFYADKENYRLDFTPGWYDRASTDTLRITVTFFAKLETITADPQPTLVSGDEMVWNKFGLGQGEQFTIRVSIPMAAFPTRIDKSNLQGGSYSGAQRAIAFFIVLFIVIIVIIALNARKVRYSGGKIFYGGMLGGRSSGGKSGGWWRSSGGGGGFGGSSMSCACACVSCACACACAGGGGAGCSRKLEHTCPVCGKRNR